MPQPIHCGPEAYTADGGPIGVLLIHGFTGSAAETRPMGEYLAARGLTVRCPLLPGHGTTARDLVRVPWRAWAGDAEAELRTLLNRCAHVFAGGMSLGSLLTLWLAAHNPRIGGIILMSPAVRLQNRLLPAALALRHVMTFSPQGAVGDDDLGDPQAAERIWCYDETPLWGAGEVYLLQRQVRRLLPRIQQPALIVQGRRDAQLHSQAGQMVYDRLGSADKTFTWLEHSGHNILADGEREALWEQSYRWILERAGGQAG